MPSKSLSNVDSTFSLGAIQWNGHVLDYPLAPWPEDGLVTIRFASENGVIPWSGGSANLPEHTFAAEFLPVGNDIQCRLCGQRIRHLLDQQDGTYKAVSTLYDPSRRSRSINTKTCEIAEGIDKSVDISIPSGVMVIADDLRPIIPSLSTPVFPTWTSAAGNEMYMESMSHIGVGWVPTSNTVVGLFRENESGRMAVAWFDDELDESRDAPEGWIRLSTIICDVWSFVFTDGGYFDNAMGAVDTDTINDIALSGKQFDHVRVEPGVYRLSRHLDGLDMMDKVLPENGFLELASIELVAE